MAGLGHIGVGFAVKPLAPKIPLGVLLVATEVPDILWAVFYFTGIDRSASMISASPVVSWSLYVRGVGYDSCTIGGAYLSRPSLRRDYRTSCF